MLRLTRELWSLGIILDNNQITQEDSKEVNQIEPNQNTIETV